MTLKRTIELLKEYLKMNTANKYRLDEINKIRDYFNNEIKERKDIILSIASYASVVVIPAGITGASLTSVLTIGTGISKSLLKLTKKRKKKHNKIIILAKNKLNTIDTLLSSALNDSEISHEEFTNIINEENIYEIIKENIKSMTEPIDDSLKNQRHYKTVT